MSLPEMPVNRPRRPAGFAVPRPFWLALAVSLLVTPLTSRPALTLTPYVPQVNFANLADQGRLLAQDAARMLQLQQFAIAQRQALLAVELAPDDGRGWLVLAESSLRLDDLPQATRALEKAQQLAPKEPGVLFALGTVSFRQQAYGKAIDYFQRGLELKPDSPGALFDLGNVYLVQKRYPEAIRNFQKAIDLRRDFWEAWNNIGLISFEQSNDNAALSAWDKALQLNNQAAETRLARAALLHAQGKQKEAIDQARQSLSTDPRYVDVDYLKQQLWGDRLLKATAALLAEPQLKEAVSEARLRQREQNQGE